MSNQSTYRYLCALETADSLVQTLREAVESLEEDRASLRRVVAICNMELDGNRGVESRQLARLILRAVGADETEGVGHDFTTRQCEARQTS